jgi:repressor LexA
LKKILKRGYTPIQKQRQILQFITRYVQENGYSPSFKEIGEAVELYSLSSVHSYLHKMEQSGLVKIGNGKSRAIKVL